MDILYRNLQRTWVKFIIKMNTPERGVVRERNSACGKYNGEVRETLDVFLMSGGLEGPDEEDGP